MTRHTVHTGPALLVAICIAAGGCTDQTTVVSGEALGTDGQGKADKSGSIESNWTRGIEHMALQLDLEFRTGLASLTLEPAPEDTAATMSLSVDGLAIDTVSTDDERLDFVVRDGALHIDLQNADTATPTVHIEYGFELQTPSNGLGENGSTVIWPYFCGNLFPCRTEPSDGLTIELVVVGTSETELAVYPERIESESPAYGLALAVGDYSCEVLGETDTGTGVSVCFFSDGRDAARTGTADLVAVFNWLESTLGPYPFGGQVASIAVDWGDGAAGGMEHHPFWHVSKDEMDLPITHAHEAAHGWFGNGVRMACWEDLVLSEGTVTYLAARALGQVTDEATEAAVWDDYRVELMWAVEHEDTVVLPDTCGEIDVIKDGLWSNVVYMKGAFFFRELADIIGADTLDRVLSNFYTDYVGEATRMVELLSYVEASTGYDPSELAEHWLRTKGDPFTR